MKNCKTTLLILTITALTISSLSAKSLTTAAPEPQLSKELAINIVQEDQGVISGRLINADETYFVFENTYDASIQVIPREEVDVLETNLNINLMNVLKSHNPESLTDVIELNDGTKIASIILDITPEGIQYFTGMSLRRQQISAEDLYAVHLNSRAVEIPFPMVATNQLAL